MKNKHYWLQLARSLVLFLGLEAAITAGLVQINPDIVNHVAYPQIITILALTVLFAVLHSAVSHIQDTAMRDALTAILTAIEHNIPMQAASALDKRTTSMVPAPIDLPPRPQTPS